MSKKKSSCKVLISSLNFDGLGARLGLFSLAFDASVPMLSALNAFKSHLFTREKGRGYISRLEHYCLLVYKYTTRFASSAPARSTSADSVCAPSTRLGPEGGNEVGQDKGGRVG